MKGFTRFCLILAGALGVIGLAGIGIGMALGARPAQFLDLAHYDGSIFHWLDNRTERLSGWIDSWSDGVDDSVEQWSDDMEEDIDSWSEELEEDIDSWSEELDENVENWSNGWEHHLEGGWEREGGHNSWSSAGPVQIQPPSGEGIDSFEDSFDTADVKKIEMDLHFAVLHIISGEEDGSIQLSGRNARNYFESRLDGSTLKLVDERTHAQYQRDQALELELVIPARQFEVIELDLGASDVHIEYLQADRVKIDVGAGLLAADSLIGNEVVVDCGVGSSTVDSLDAQKNAKLDVGTGELTVNHFTGGDLELDCGVGTLDVTAAGNEADYNYSLDCGIGTIQLGSSSYSGLDRSKTIDNRADKQVHADCGIGMISLDFE